MSDSVPVSVEDSSTDTADGTPSATGGTAPAWLARLGYTMPGLWVALVLACLSFTPSLLPRSGLFQGAIAGIAAAIGYGLGVLGAWVWRGYADRRPREPRAGAWLHLTITAVVLLLVSMWLGIRWQGQSAELVGIAAPSPASWLLVVPVGLFLFLVVTTVGRGIRNAARWATRVLDRFMGRRAARATAVVLVTALIAWFVSGVAVNGIIGALDRSFAVANELTPEDVTAPTSPLRSGTAESLVEWDTLGREGRVFVAGGPTAAQIGEVTGTPAMETIRVFAGMESEEDIELRAKLAVDDLERAGGFERKNLLVVTTTGSGWVEPSSTASFEYLSGGDSAIVAMQYSYLPSWLSVGVDRTRAGEAGRLLFDEVYGRLMAKPESQRPKLYVFGESLGSFGGESAFSGEHDIANRIDGGLFTGPPSFNSLYRQFVDHRDPGSTEVQPVFRDGRTVRFTTDPFAPTPPVDKQWTGTRLLYLQHASDGVTWWSGDLLLQRPDWLVEPRGSDVTDAMTWMPFVTFWQVAGDMALTAPRGHGHNFTGQHAGAWAQILQPEGWTDAQTRAVSQLTAGD